MTTPRARRAGEVLLGAFSQDVSPRSAKEKTLLALAAGGAVSSAAAHAAAGTKAAGVANGGVLATAGGLKVAVVKAALVGALFGAATLGGAHVVRTTMSEKPAATADDRSSSMTRGERALRDDRAMHPPNTPERPSVAEPPALTAPPSAGLSNGRKESERALGRPSEAVIPRNEPRASELPLEPAFPTAAPAVAGAPGIAPLAGEIRLVDAARAALVAADPSRAFRALDQYAAEFPDGKLAEEATVLRIEALARVGDMAGAERLASDFIRAHPASGHLSKVRSILSKGSSR